MVSYDKSWGFNCHSEKFSAAAKLTQARYGSNSMAARRLNFQKDSIVSNINNQSRIMSAKATAPRRQAKNSQLHTALKASCARYNHRALRFFSKPPTRHTSQAAIPIIRYNRLHTGPNSQAGGAQPGKTS